MAQSAIARIVDHDPNSYRYTGYSVQVCTCPAAWWGIYPPPCPIHNPPKIALTMWPPITVTTNTTINVIEVKPNKSAGDAMRADDV